MISLVEAVFRGIKCVGGWLGRFPSHLETSSRVFRPSRSSATLQRAFLTPCLLLAWGIVQQATGAENNPGPQLPRSRPAGASVLPNGEDIILYGQPGDRLVASYDGLEMYEEEFYMRLNGSVHWFKLTGPDKLEDKALLWRAVREGLTEKNMQREAVRNGANDDPIFLKYLERSRLSSIAALGAVTLRPMLPEPHVLDTSTPGDDELRSRFHLWQKVEVKAEPIDVHYIVLSKKENDPDHNEIQGLKAEQALARIEGGEDFINVKLEVSDESSPSSEPWKFERRDESLRPLREIIEFMEAGEVSEVLERDSGFYIFYVLPDQEWNDFSSLEAIKTNPPLLQKLVEHTISLRPHNKPLHDYLDTQLDIPAGYQEFDWSSLPGDRLPSPETILAGLDNLQFTFQDMDDVTQLTSDGDRAPLTRHSVEQWARALRYEILLTDLVDRGEIEIDESVLTGFELSKMSWYGKWLRLNLWQMYLLTEPGEQQDSQDVINAIKQTAQDHIESLRVDVVESLTLHLPWAQLDYERVDWFDPDKYGEKVEPIDPEEPANPELNN